MWCSDPRRAALWCFGVSLAFLLTTHWSFLRLPYHWDELGYFVPAARDLLVSGALVPRSTPPNVHPPLVLAWLAVAWRLFGFSPLVTRLAMLAIGAASITALYGLARRLAGARAGWAAAAMAAVSPPFVAQSMLAHLDLAATLWTLLAVLWFLDGRWGRCAAASTALVLTKETGLIVPVVLAALAGSRRGRLTVLLPPASALALWLLILRSQTGHWLGNAEFARYNVDQALEVWRIPMALARRAYQLGFANFHWIAAALLLWRRGTIRGREWRVLAMVAAASLALHSMVGGALLVRYLLPAMALWYAATAAALETLGPRARAGILATLLAGLAASNWWNPPYPFGYEDNLAVADFIRLQQDGARWLSDHARERRVTTAWPLTDALTNPTSGYVERPLTVEAIENFQPESWASVAPGAIDVAAVYSRSWEPERGWQRWGPLARLLERHFAWRPQLPVEEVRRRFGLEHAARFERRGQWMEILTRPSR